MKRYRIGLLVGNKSIDYIQAIRMGVQNTIEDAGHVLIAISDLIPFHARINAKEYFRVAFEVTSRLDLDAVIVPAGVIASYLSTEYKMFGELLSILDPQKTLVIERNIEGYRCIGKDSNPGMHECMRHLIENRGFKRIAFLGGPASSTSATQREAIYREEMRAHGLKVTASLVEHGEYSGECGDSIDKLIDNNPGLEAIACCCDLEAYAVYRTLRNRRLTVGKDIAVTGFDDHAMSAHLNPPLSTVHMTGYDLGCMAAREAIRLHEKKPQQEHTLSSSFIARGSCGENEHDRIMQLKELLAQKPFPVGEVASIIANSTLMMANKRIEDDFRAALEELVTKVERAYRAHFECGDELDQLFSTQDLSVLFSKDYRDRLSLEGFRSVAILILQALMEMAPKEESNWLVAQLANLHLGLSRMLNVAVQDTKVSMGKREWTAFHMADDALRESMNPRLAYELILREFGELGVRKADLYLLSEPEVFIGSRTFALSDTLLPIGTLVNNEVIITEGTAPIALQDVLDNLIESRDNTSVYTVGGIMAGNELVGIAAIDSGTLDYDGQLIAFLNLGVAFKHLQMIASERESNELLSKSNLLLERQSHYDEMTGILNRRGFMNKLRSVIEQHEGENGALFYMDLDGLKYINDTYGHDSGDDAIRQATRVLEAFMPRGTVLGRLGGDEFVAFALVSSERDIKMLGRSVEAGMETYNATHSSPYDLAISYGGVYLPIDKGTFTNINKSLIVADERLYQMKKGHKTSRRFSGD
ncbi:MAG: GGDEF domain-containing protein [Atopobiaceae bacterium]|nr:GGDEF domain-containing protein [Atopobiaceae bacterium]